MGLEVRRAKPGPGDMGVNLGRGEALVAEQLLDDPQVRAAVEEVGGKAVAQGVRRDAERQAGPGPEPVEPEAEPTNTERPACLIEEDLGRRIGARVEAAARASRTGRPSRRYSSSARRAGRPSRPIRSLRPLPTTRISPRRRSTEPSVDAASSLIRSPAA